ncbi:hypothetical protein [Cellulomonas xylanilytica]|uniref:DUF4386 domain-containing protein n=1 Tax=Cellulomonas xylanilytica TaxID=233583 RepID=A0A510V7K7_9CELL|nr:hypothetical protein [Cellulomonas xylanilytica]GEK21125.1 hypothetical protein CXY01_16450 [Cellulomonas xylanilytica]
MSTPVPGLVARRWRSRRSAAVAGIVFAVLLIAALVMMRLAVGDETVGGSPLDARRRALVGLALDLVPFAGIAFLWFIGVVRDQLGEVEDRLFSTVFLGSGLLFLAMVFQGAVTASSLVAMTSGEDLDAGVWTFGRSTTEALVSVYAMRMAAVFTLSVSTVALRTAAVPRWVPFSGYAVALVLLLVAGQHKWAQLLFPVWVLVLSVAILLTPGRARTTGTG